MISYFEVPENHKCQACGKKALRAGYDYVIQVSASKATFLCLGCNKSFLKASKIK